MRGVEAQLDWDASADKLGAEEVAAARTLVLCQSLKQVFTDLKKGPTVIPAQAGVQIAALVSRLRGNDETPKPGFDEALVIDSQISFNGSRFVRHQIFSKPWIRVLFASVVRSALVTDEIPFSVVVVCNLPIKWFRGKHAAKATRRVFGVFKQVAAGCQQSQQRRIQKHCFFCVHGFSPVGPDFKKGFAAEMPIGDREWLEFEQQWNVIVRMGNERANHGNAGHSCGGPTSG